MAKESGRKCSNCGNNGHNSRTCNEKVGLKLFGVRISKDRGDDSMKKSLSMGNLHTCMADKSSGDRDYLSDGLVHSRRDEHERKRGVPWSEEEHRTFLAGLEKLGKGDWRGISRKFVITRTPTQVASHAQKYFLRQATANRKKRRSSLFDVSIKNPPRTYPIAPALPMKRTKEVPGLIGSLAKISTQGAARGLEVPSITPMAATCSVPNFHGIPYMMGISNGRVSYPEPKVFPTVSFIPVVNFPNPGYVYLQPKHHNNISPCTYVPPESSSVSSSPQLFSHRASQMEPGSSSAVSTDLELSIAPPRNQDRTKISSQTSNLGGGAIRVV